MSFNALAIMFRPMLANYLQPLEENGTIAKLQSDIELVAKSNAIPELAKLVAGLEKNNALLERLTLIFEIHESRTDANRNEEPAPQREYSSFPDSIAGTAGPIGNDGAGMLATARTD